ncbi:DUF397 domain-containing protein [Actinoallomurus rhizosphaericola]
MAVMKWRKASRSSSNGGNCVEVTIVTAVRSEASAA